MTDRQAWLAKLRERYPRAYKPWLLSEKRTLVTLHEDGRSVVEIADLLGRQPTAITAQLEKIAEAGLPKSAVPAEPLRPLLSDAERTAAVGVAADQVGEGEFALALLDALTTRVTERHAIVAAERWGLDGSRFRTLESLGAKFGITAERVRQLEDQLLRRVRSCARGVWRRRDSEDPLFAVVARLRIAVRPDDVADRALRVLEF